MKVKPLGNKVLVKPKEAETKTEAGIYIPDSAKEKTQKGEILAVGPGKIDDKGKRQEMPVKVGDKVMYESYGGTEIKIEGKKHLIMDVKDILAKIE
ncbi:co-chaperone GroES [Candidatus Woesearchaeota archaeon]|nr:co-chaperone GroES [Candidatus Woesearchaeota archaeon]